MTPSQEHAQEAIFTIAHEDFEQGLQSYAFFKTSNHATGEDLVQDTFLKTWKYLIKGGKIDTMKAFLYHVLNHLILDEYRKHKTVSLDALMEKGLEPGFDHVDRLVNFIDGKAAFLLIEKLPVKCREIIRMRYAQSLSIEEISAITGQTKNAIAVQSLRGLARLRILYLVR